jgi:1,4-alpha-glucan branching enzyme
MLRTMKNTLANYRGQADRTGTLVAMYDTELFGHWWWEGPEFLYELARLIHADGEIQPSTGSEVLDADPAKHLIALPEGCWGEGGYHYIWINDDNHWTWKKLYAVERKLRQMAQEYADGPAKEIVQQAAREMLLAESSDWQFLISTFSARDYAEVRFNDHISRFDRLAEIATRVHTGSAMTIDEKAFLKECQQKDAPFQDLDLSLWKIEAADQVTAAKA